MTSKKCNTDEIEKGIKEKRQQIENLKLTVMEAQKNIIGELNSVTLEKCKFSNIELLNELITMEGNLEKKKIEIELIKETNKVDTKSTISNIRDKEILHKEELKYIKDMYEKEIKVEKEIMEKYEKYINKKERREEEYNTKKNVLEIMINKLRKTIINLKGKLHKLKIEKDTILDNYHTKYTLIENKLKENIKIKTEKYCCPNTINLDEFNKKIIKENIPIDNNIFNEIDKLIKKIDQMEEKNVKREENKIKEEKKVLKGGDNEEIAFYEKYYKKDNKDCVTQKRKLKLKLKELKIQYKKLYNILQKCYMYNEQKGVTLDEICYTNIQVINKINEIKKKIEKYDKTDENEIKMDVIEKKEEKLSKYSNKIKEWEMEKIKMKTEYTVKLNELRNKRDEYKKIYGVEIEDKMNDIINENIKKLTKKEDIKMELENIKIKVENIINIQEKNNDIIKTKSLILMKKQIQKNTDILKKMEECPECL